ncbi:kinase-like domain-containing protein, partial [Penicillium cosmopolitanum]
LKIVKVKGIAKLFLSDKDIKILVLALLLYPNIVLFNYVVVEDIESRVIRFTMKYILGRTLDNTNIPF